MEFFKIRRTIPFMRHALVFNVLSLITFLAAVFFLVHRGLNYSIEFTGGTLMEVAYSRPAEIENIRQALEKAGYKAEVQNFGSARDVLLRLHLEKNQSSADLSQKVQGVLKEQDASAEVRRVEFVGPQVGKELVEYGALALLTTAVFIVLYLWIRFEWRFGHSKRHSKRIHRSGASACRRSSPTCTMWSSSWGSSPSSSGSSRSPCSPRCSQCSATR